jgi:hypothetical protein
MHAHLKCRQIGVNYGCLSNLSCRMEQCFRPQRHHYDTVSYPATKQAHMHCMRTNVQQQQQQISDSNDVVPTSLHYAMRGDVRLGYKPQRLGKKAAAGERCARHNGVAAAAASSSSKQCMRAQQRQQPSVPASAWMAAAGSSTHLALACCISATSTAVKLVLIQHTHPSDCKLQCLLAGMTALTTGQAFHREL